jgi:hypothetical protein
LYPWMAMARSVDWRSMRRLSDGCRWRLSRLCAAILVAASATIGCRPATPPPAQAVRIAPDTLAVFWTDFTAADQTKLAAALRLLLEHPEIADAPFVAGWSMLGGPAASKGALGAWSLADGTKVMLDPMAIGQLDASIDAVVAVTEADDAKRPERKLELLRLIDRIGERLWEASEAFATARGGLFGESDAARRSREFALFDLRSYGLLLRHAVQEHLEQSPPALVDRAELARRKEELRALRAILLGEAPNAATP